MATTYVYRELKSKVEVETITATTSLDAGDSNKTFLVGTDALVITLPSTVAGLRYTFMNSGADGNNIITLSPAAADGIAGTITLAASVVQLDGTIDKDAILTKSTGLLGDSITIVGTGNAGTGAWLIESANGIWAREA
jgi:hypothetical protein